VNIEWTDTHVQQYQTWEEFRKEHPVATVLSIDDKPFAGCCEACDKPVFDGDGHIDGEDDMHLCAACASEAKKEDWI
jgi:hypothetical protein